jgi:tRNA A37 methylthiotransferase MiaB
LGDDVGAYGIDTGQNFAQLMARLISELDTINKNMPEKNKRLADVKFHIQEIHPHWLIKFRQELLELMKSKRIKSILCPIESGNDRILGLMNRRYNVDEISAFFKEARSIYPDILYSTHLMVGFPSETEEEFEDSLNAIVKIHFAHVTVFPYDQKEGTPASEITPQIDKLTINKRLDKTRKFLKHAGIKTYLSCPE